MSRRVLACSPSKKSWHKYERRLSRSAVWNEYVVLTLSLICFVGLTPVKQRTNETESFRVKALGFFKVTRNEEYYSEEEKTDSAAKEKVAPENIVIKERQMAREEVRLLTTKFHAFQK